MRPIGWPPIAMSKYTIGLSGDLRAFTVAPSPATGMFCCVGVFEAAGCDGRAISVDWPSFFSLLPQIPIAKDLTVNAPCNVVTICLRNKNDVRREV